jgi:hypothetical protein
VVLTRAIANIEGLQQSNNQAIQQFSNSAIPIYNANKQLLTFSKLGANQQQF